MTSNPRLDMSLDDLIKKAKKKPAPAAKKPAGQAAKKPLPASKGKAGGQKQQQQQPQKPGAKGKAMQQQKQPVQKQGLKARGGIQKAGGGAAARPAGKVGPLLWVRMQLYSIILRSKRTVLAGQFACC